MKLPERKKFLLTEQIVPFRQSKFHSNNHRNLHYQTLWCWKSYVLFSGVLQRFLDYSETDSESVSEKHRLTILGSINFSSNLCICQVYFCHKTKVMMYGHWHKNFQKFSFGEILYCLLVDLWWVIGLLWQYWNMCFLERNLKIWLQIIIVNDANFRGISHPISIYNMIDVEWDFLLKLQNILSKLMRCENCDISCHFGYLSIPKFVYTIS